MQNWEPGGQKLPTIKGKSEDVLDVLFSGLKASPVAWASLTKALKDK
jgi:hypothetical protein